MRVVAAVVVQGVMVVVRVVVTVRGVAVHSSPVRSNPTQSTPLHSPVQNSPLQSSPVQSSPVQPRPMEEHGKAATSRREQMMAGMALEYEARVSHVQRKMIQFEFPSRARCLGARTIIAVNWISD